MKTASDIPKGQLMECMKILQHTEAKAPVKSGEVIVKNIGGTGVDLVATKTVNKY